MKFISNTRTVQWAYSVSLIFVFKANCWKPAEPVENLCEVILIFVIAWDSFGFDSFK